MLAPGDAHLVQRDHALPGMRLLLDDDALAGRLGAPVRRRYLRYKPGTACVQALDVDGARAFAVAYSAESLPKLHKTVRAAPAGTLLLVDLPRRVVVARPAADRDLPFLARLEADPAAALGPVLPDRSLRNATLTTLSHKPQRRWVGLLRSTDAEPIVLRVHRPKDARTTVAAAQALTAADVWVPSLVGAAPARGVVALTWLPGTSLHDLVLAGTATPQHLRDMGAAVAGLHALPVRQLRVRTTEEDARDVRRAAAAVRRLRPDLARLSRAVQASVEQALPQRGATPVTSHGDLSTDQVVVGQDGRTGLVDLDRVVAAEPAADLGSALAAMHVDACLADVGGDVGAAAATLLHGYGRPLEEQQLRAHTAAALLRRAVDPFRLCSPRWPEQTEALLGLAWRVCPVRVRT